MYALSSPSALFIANHATLKADVKFEMITFVISIVVMRVNIPLFYFYIFVPNGKDFLKEKQIRGQYSGHSMTIQSDVRMRCMCK